MAKKNLLTIVLLSVVLITATGCGGANSSVYAGAEAPGESENADDIFAQAYDKYVENGGTLLYEDWLEAVLSIGKGDDLDYYPQDDGTYAVCLEKYKDLTTFTIPSSFRGERVTKVRKCIYTPNFSCVSITIPDTITWFDNDSVSSVVTKEITYEGSLEQYCNIHFDNHGLCEQLCYVFYNGYGQRVIQNPSIRIGGVFLNGDVKIPDSIQEIKKGAFNGFDLATSFTLPDKLTSIGDYAFKNCTSLKTIDLGKNITNVGEQAFFNDKSLESFDCGDSLTEIGSSAFSGCNAMKYVVIPKTVKTIDDYAFDWCENLNDIYFTGTEEEWNNIQKGDMWLYSSPTMHYNYAR